MACEVRTDAGAGQDAGGSLLISIISSDIPKEALSHMPLPLSYPHANMPAATSVIPYQRVLVVACINLEHCDSIRTAFCRGMFHSNTYAMMRFVFDCDISPVSAPFMTILRFYCVLMLELLGKCGLSGKQP